MDSVTRPAGIPCVINGKPYHLTFTLGVIENLETAYDMPISEIIKQMTEQKQVYKVLWDIVLAMVNDEISWENHEKNEENKLYTKEEIGWCISINDTGKITRDILEAYGFSLPQKGDNPNSRRAQRKTESPKNTISRGSSTSGKTDSDTQSRKSGG